MHTSAAIVSLAVLVALPAIACTEAPTGSGESSVTGTPASPSGPGNSDPSPAGEPGEEPAEEGPADDPAPSDEEPAPSAPTTSYPTALSVFSHFGTGKKALHLLSSDLKTVSTSVSVAGPPQFVPSKPTQLPLLTGKTFVVSKPARGACTATVLFTLNGAQVSLGFAASDTLPSTACSDFADKIVKQGIAGTIDTKYPNGIAVRVTLDLTP